MHPAISYHLAQTHIADLRHDARRDSLARAARCAGQRCRPGMRPCGRTGPVPFPALSRPLSPRWRVTQPLAELAPSAA
jgi:hypothetical protein